MTLSWIDSHCHLGMLKDETNEGLSATFDNELALCVTIGTDYQSSLKVVDYCDQYTRVYGAVGIHPHNASQTRKKDLEALSAIAVNHPKLVAIGECGFDYYYKRSTEDDQLSAFVAQLDVAVETQLPVVIHSREADDAVKDVLGEYKDQSLTGVFHSFTSSIELARWVLDAGFYISFNGICTFPGADSVREVLRYMPLDRIILETDAPFLAPVPLRGKPNHPKNVSLVGAFVAEFLKIPAETLADTVFNNTVTLFQKIKL